MFTIPATTCKETVRCLAFAAIFFIQLTADSQVKEAVFEHFTVEQGLPDNGVWAILQDHKGFMWFGTTNGLAKYDGYHFTVYSSSLGANIPLIYEDNSGALWVRNPSLGLSRCDRATERITHYFGPTPVVDLCEDAAGNLWLATAGEGLKKFDESTWALRQYNVSNDTLSCICAEIEEKGTILWIGGASGVDRFDPADGTFTHVEQCSGYRVTAMYKDNAGTLWIGTRGGLYVFNEATGTSRRYPVPKWRSSHPNHDFVHSFYEDRRGILWIGAGDELFSVDRATEKCVQYRPGMFPIALPVKITNPIREDGRGYLWLKNIHPGLSRLDPANNTMVSYVHDPKDPSSLSDNAVNEVYVDRSGTLWIGTVWGGVNKLDRARKAFRHYAPNPAHPWSLIHNVVLGVCEDRSGRVWVATRGGLERFDRRTERFTHFQHDPMDPHSLSSNIVRAVLADHEGTIWVGTEACGLDRLDPAEARGDGGRKGTFRHWTHDPTNPRGLGSNHINTLFEDRSGNIWVGTRNAGLDQICRNSGDVVHYRYDVGDPNSLGSNWVNAICEDSKGGLWVGTGGGSFCSLSRLDTATGKFARFRHVPRNAKSIGPGPVRSIYEDRGGTLWIGTIRSLNRYEPSTQTFTRFRTPQDTIGDFIAGILEDDSGYLWLKTNKGVSKFNPRTGTFTTYDRSDGVPICPTWDAVCCGSSNGEMFFGGINGLVRFHPDSIKDNPYIPPVVITGFKIFDKPVSLDTAISEKKLLQLTYQDNVLSFDFVALNYSSPEKNQYAYKLEGFDSDWTYCGTRRNASYTNLDAGSYVFRVKGSNNDGVWNEAGTSIAVLIAPPWWQTPWAYIGYGIVGLLFLGGLRRYDRKRIQLKHQLEMKDFEADKLRELDSMKMRFFANISHEFRTPLTLILGPVEHLLSRTELTAEREELNIVHRSALRLLELISQILDISKLEVGRMKMKVQALDLVPFLRGLVLSFASLAERKQIDLEYQPTEEKIIGYVDRDKLQKIVTNLLSNALKFTQEGGKVRVHVSTAEGDRNIAEAARRNVEISVCDTGVGVPLEEQEKIFRRFYQVDGSREREHQGSGLGLALVKELVQIHRGDISVTSEPGRGSAFQVRLPLGKEEWNEEEIVEAAEGEERPPVAGVDALQETAEGEGREEQERTPEEWAGEDLPLVLIVEDNADLRDYLRRNLGGHYRLEEAVDGLAGLKAAQKRMPDLVVSDIMMPGMDGVELCRKLKNDERTSHMPVILLTARASDEGKLEGLETGADDYIIKPFDIKELRARIQNLIELRTKLREKYRRHCLVEPGNLPVDSIDERFLRKALEVVRSHLSDPGFDNTRFARELCLSRMQLNRKLQALTGHPTHEFVRELRMQCAMKLLQSHWGNVTEVAYEVGFNSLSSFARAFRDHYGVSPSEYLARPMGQR